MKRILSDMVIFKQRFKQLLSTNLETQQPTSVRRLLRRGARGGVKLVVNRLWFSISDSEATASMPIKQA